MRFQQLKNGYIHLFLIFTIITVITVNCTYLNYLTEKFHDLLVAGNLTCQIYLLLLSICYINPTHEVTPIMKSCMGIIIHLYGAFSTLYLNLLKSMSYF